MAPSSYPFPWYVFGDIETVLAVRSQCTSPNAVTAENAFYDWVANPDGQAQSEASAPSDPVLISHIRLAVEAGRQSANPWPSSWPLSVALVKPGTASQPAKSGPTKPAAQAYLEGTTCYIEWPPPRFAALPSNEQKRFYIDTGLSIPTAPPPPDAVPISALLYAYDWGYVEGNDQLLTDAVQDPDPVQRRTDVAARLRQLVYPKGGSLPGSLSLQIDPTVPTVDTDVLVSSGAVTLRLGAKKVAPTAQMVRYPCGGFDT